MGGPPEGGPHECGAFRRPPRTHRIAAAIRRTASGNSRSLSHAKLKRAYGFGRRSNAFWRPVYPDTPWAMLRDAHASTSALVRNRTHSAMPPGGIVNSMRSPNVRRQHVLDREAHQRPAVDSRERDEDRPRDRS